MDLIRIAAVSYLNTKPFLFGLENSAIKKEIELTCFTPAECADRLINNEADIGLIPVAAIPKIKGAEIISDYCIGSNGPVNSVLLLSEQPIEKIKTVMLDYQSRTSVQLVKVLFKYHWKLSPEFTGSEVNFENLIKDQTAAVVIGDRALKIKEQFKFCYDLSQAWFELTGLPFVFACWISNKKIPADFIEKFNQALATGVNNIEAVVENLKLQTDFYSETFRYLKESIDYNFDANKKTALQLFYEYSNELGIGN